MPSRTSIEGVLTGRVSQAYKRNSKPTGTLVMRGPTLLVNWGVGGQLYNLPCGPVYLVQNCMPPQYRVPLLRILRGRTHFVVLHFLRLYPKNTSHPAPNKVR